MWISAQQQQVPEQAPIFYPGIKSHGQKCFQYLNLTPNLKTTPEKLISAFLAFSISPDVVASVETRTKIKN